MQKASTFPSIKWEQGLCPRASHVYKHLELATGPPSVPNKQTLSQHIELSKTSPRGPE